jgi:hypothetical protein
MQSLPPLHDENNSIIKNVIPEEMKWKQQLPSHRSFFPKIRLKKIELAGLLAHLTFCGLPVPCGTVAELAKAFRRFTAAGTAPVLHRIPFSDSLP